MISINNKIPTRRLSRIMNVIVVYEYELFNEKIDTKEVFESDLYNELFDYNQLLDSDKNNSKKVNDIIKEQLQIINVIEKNYENFKNMIIKFIRDDWTWLRIDPLIRSILLCASAELWKLDIGIVANEYVEIAKEFIPDEQSFKFINAVIEKIGNIYYEFKQKKD